MSPCSEESALLEFRVTMLFFLYCLCTVNKNNWFVVAPTFFSSFSFLFARFSFMHFACALFQLHWADLLFVVSMMMHLIINTLSKTYVANFHPLLFFLHSFISRGLFPSFLWFLFNVYYCIGMFCFPAFAFDFYFVPFFLPSLRFADVISIAVRMQNFFSGFFFPLLSQLRKGSAFSITIILYRFSGEFLLLHLDVRIGVKQENEVIKQN